MKSVAKSELKKSREKSGRNPKKPEKWSESEDKNLRNPEKWSEEILKRSGKKCSKIGP